MLRGRAPAAVAWPISRLVATREPTLTWDVPPNRMPFWSITSTVQGALIVPRIWEPWKLPGVDASDGARRPVSGSRGAADLVRVGAGGRLGRALPGVEAGRIGGGRRRLGHRFQAADGAGADLTAQGE